MSLFLWMLWKHSLLPPPPRLYLHHCEDPLVGDGISTDSKVSSVVMWNEVSGLPVFRSSIVSVCHIHSSELVVVPVLHRCHVVLHAPQTEKKSPIMITNWSDRLDPKITESIFLRLLRLTESGLNCGAWLLMSETCMIATPSLVSPMPPISATCSFNLNSFTTYGMQYSTLVK